MRTSWARMIPSGCGRSDGKILRHSLTGIANQPMCLCQHPCRVPVPIAKLPKTRLSDTSQIQAEIANVELGPIPLGLCLGVHWYRFQRALLTSKSLRSRQTWRHGLVRIVTACADGIAYQRLRVEPDTGLHVDAPCNTSSGEWMFPQCVL